jgi:outer membrane protein assembly factor BamE (lipoprotein component of BamABCDE complex)
MIKKVFLFLCVALPLTGCMTAAQHQQTLPSAEERKLTTGVVQKEIYEGMSQADVAAALGSPNLVTKDKKGVETWIYDKISTEYAYSSSAGGVNALVLGWGGSAAGLGGGNYNRSSGASSTTQRTLTIIIKFIEGEVNEFTYRSSSF